MEVDTEVYNINSLTLFMGFPGDAGSKRAHLLMQETLRVAGLIPMSLRSPEDRHGNPLHYSCLGISWTEEPGGLQSMGSQGVRYNSNDSIHTCNLIWKVKVKVKPLSHVWLFATTWTIAYLIYNSKKASNFEVFPHYKAKYQSKKNQYLKLDFGAFGLL